MKKIRFIIHHQVGKTAHTSSSSTTKNIFSFFRVVFASFWWSFEGTTNARTNECIFMYNLIPNE